MTWKQTTKSLDRFYSCLPYIIPMSAVVIYGGILFEQFPLLVLPFTPLIWFYLNVMTFPVVPVLRLTLELFIFLGLYFFVVRDNNISYFIRFNAAQALLLNIIIILVSIVVRLIDQISFLSFARDILLNATFIGINAACIYSIFRCVRGEYAEIPVISEAAKYQVR
ncbi:MAG: hypothetical protein AUK48_15495 [Oscillatoriales cyanobacterium CG2_30_44_21]|nr:MAG: hypothetical protein AUK48_15495 [Oscillatoriales cyanobacterium CG2_30_44_21]